VETEYVTEQMSIQSSKTSVWIKQNVHPHNASHLWQLQHKWKFYFHFICIMGPFTICTEPVHQFQWFMVFRLAFFCYRNV